MFRVAELPKLALCVGFVSLALATAPAPGLPLGPPAAAAATARSGGPVDRAIGLLQSAQRPDGGFATSPSGTDSHLSTSVWAALALASVGINPADQPRRGKTVLDYLTAQAAQVKTTEDLARLVIVLRAAGPPAEAAAATAVQTLVARQQSDGMFPDRVNGSPRVAATAFAALALAGNAAVPTAASQATAWLRGARSGSGWGIAPGGSAQAGLTGLALQALRAVEPDEFAITTSAQTFLARNGNPDGGLSAARPKTSDPVATAWAMQGLRASGVDPRTYESLGGGTPGKYLAAQQREDGAFGSVARTAQVLAGLNGSPFPLAAVPTGSKRASAKASDAPTTERTDGASGGSGGSTESLSDAQAGESGSSDSASGSGSGSSSSSSSSSSSGGSPGATSSALPEADPAPSSSADASPLPDEIPTTPADVPAPETTPEPASEPAPAEPAGDQVSGVAVGVEGTPPAGLAGGGGGDTSGDEVGPTAALGGAILIAILLGSGLERRRPRRLLS